MGICVRAAWELNVPIDDYHFVELVGNGRCGSQTCHPSTDDNYAVSGHVRRLRRPIVKDAEIATHLRCSLFQRRSWWACSEPPPPPS